MTIDATAVNPVHSEERVISALSEVLDPELGIDVVSLGLVYELHLIGDAITVQMTLTTPGCPLHDTIERDVRRRLERLDGVRSVDVQMVWDPPWHPSRMTDAARAHLRL
jgi:metal-sulfur cluster biosynthetic enzyme